MTSASVGKTAVLYTGELVDTASEEWRHECEARTVLRMASKQQRQLYLYGDRDQGILGVQGRRGRAAVKRLEETILALWRAGNEEN